MNVPPTAADKDDDAPPKTFEVGGMHCRSCVGRVGDAARGVPGVESAEVSLDPPRLRVRTGETFRRDRLEAAVAAAGDYTLGDKIDHGAGDDETAPETTGPAAETGAAGRHAADYFPLALVVAFLIGGVAVAAVRSGPSYGVVDAAADFMGLFFVSFAFFKLLDLRGFQTAYLSYDLVARAWPTWGFIYPFVELTLGVSYLVRIAPAATNAVTLLVMTVGGVGVLRAVLSQTRIRCACLGTVFNLPMSTVTLVEDFGMAAMAAAMLAFGL